MAWKMHDFPFKPPSAGVGIPPTSLLLEHIPSTVPKGVSVDVEMAMLFVGARLFRTDEAILTPDWLPNGYGSKLGTPVIGWLVLN